MARTAKNAYHVPHAATWPMTGSVGLTMLFAGFAWHLNGAALGSELMAAGMVVIIVMMVGWFGAVVAESEGGVYKRWEDKSFRLGMAWFIFSEVMFFAAFFGALFYARSLSVPWLLGEGSGASTHEFLWSDYTELWPTNGPGDLGESDFHMGWWPLPFINTVILLTSGLTVTWAHHAIKQNHRQQFIAGLSLTVGLGFLFVFLQGVEYAEGLPRGPETQQRRLRIHLLHADRLSRPACNPRRDHAERDAGAARFAATSPRSATSPLRRPPWYWHFVDVVWLGLFLFVYIL